MDEDTPRECGECGRNGPDFPTCPRPASECPTKPAWAQAAADAVLADLMDRRGIRQSLWDVEDADPKTWEEIRTTLAQIIRDKASVTPPAGS